MLEMIPIEFQMEIFREFETRRAEFLRMDQLDAFKKGRKRTTPEEWDAAITRKIEVQNRARYKNRKHDSD